MKCPTCPAELLEDWDEVDIGVGVQRGNYRYECPTCGPVATCQYCGAWTDAEEHRPSCSMFQEWELNEMNEEMQDFILTEMFPDADEDLLAAIKDETDE